MRRYNIYNLIAYTLVTSMTFISCGSEEAVPDGFMVTTDFFKVINDTLRIDGQATEAQLTITADCDWHLQTSGWDDLHATPDHGEGTGIVTISTPKNSRPAERKGTLVITTGSDIRKSLTLVQGPDSVRLQMTPETLSFGINGGETDVTVNSNTTWTLTGGSDWCRANVNRGDNGTATVTVTADKTGEKDLRTATFTITPTGGTPKSISVTQTKKEIILSTSTENINFNATAGQERGFTVACNDRWTASVSDDWLNISATTAEATSTDMETTYVTVRCVEDNTTGIERSATITINSSGVVSKINVRQGVVDTKEAHFNVTLGQMKTDGTGGTLAVISDTTWTVTCDAEWCKLKDASGNDMKGVPNRGSKRVTIELDANPTAEERRASIVFSPNGLAPVDISVLQREGSIEIILAVSQKSLSFGAVSGEEQKVRIDCNGKWEATHVPEWVELSAKGGDGSTDMTVSCSTNATGDERKDSIVISSGTKEVQVSIAQATAELPVVDGLEIPDTVGLNPTVTARYTSMLPVTAYGIVYATHKAPTLDDTAVSSKVEGDNSTEEGTISAKLSDVKPNTTYYIRAFAQSAVGVGYSEEKSLTIKTKPNQDDNAKPDLR